MSREVLQNPVTAAEHDCGGCGRCENCRAEDKERTRMLRSGELRPPGEIVEGGAPAIADETPPEALTSSEFGHVNQAQVIIQKLSAGGGGKINFWKGQGEKSVLPALDEVIAKHRPRKKLSDAEKDWMKRLRNTLNEIVK